MTAPLSTAISNCWTREHLEPFVVGVFLGEGVGAEVISAALTILDILAAKCRKKIDVKFGGKIGRCAADESGKPLPEEAVAFCESVFASGGAVLCGPGSARFVYEMRARFDLFCKLTPLRPAPELIDAALIRPESLTGVDIMAVRENAGGLYFARESLGRTPDGGQYVEAKFNYCQRQVQRILDVAERLALQRGGRVCLVVKRDGVPAMSNLWCEVARQREGRAPVEWRVLDIDNAVYQLVADPKSFDVLVSPNMFGDVLADCGSLLLGSRGLSYSGNFSDDGKGVFQTGHGAAYDLAGTGRVNPVGQILALAMMLEEAFNWREGAEIVRRAVYRTLGDGVRTQDIRGARQSAVGCREMTQRIGDALEQT